MSLSTPPIGRFAPSPSGRMHLGNAFTALVSWLSVRSKGGKWLLRIEDLDPQRSKPEFARWIEDDLHWLGLDWDLGGTQGIGMSGPCMQSLRNDHYSSSLSKLAQRHLLYPCHCTRADIMATQAPHEADGRVVYAGTCRPATSPPFPCSPSALSGQTLRLFVPDKEIAFTDVVFGPQSVNLSSHCGDFIVRRKDGAWAYQLAVVTDDALMGVTEVVRGADLLLSSAQQIYLYSLLGHKAPTFAHLPLICNQDGQRLSKRDSALSFHALRQNFSPQEIIGHLAHLAGITPSVRPCTPQELIPIFSWDSIPTEKTICLEKLL